MRNIFLLLFILTSGNLLSQIPDTALANQYLKDARSFRKEGAHKQAKETYLKAEKIYLENEEQYAKELALVYSNLGGLHREIWDVSTSIIYHKKALAIYSKIEEENRQLSLMLPHNLGNVYNQIGEYEKAIYYQEMALEVSVRDYGETHTYTAIVLNNLGNALWNLERWEEAEKRLQESLEIRQKTLSPDHPRIGNALLSFAFFFRDKGQHGKAFSFVKKAESIVLKNYGKVHPKTAELYTAWSTFYLVIDNFEKAIEVLKKAKIATNYEGDFLKVNDLLIFLSILQNEARANLALFKKVQQQAYLDTAKTHFEEALAIINHIQYGYDDELTKGFLIEDYYYLFEIGIEIYYQYYLNSAEALFLEKTWGISERVKSDLLLQNIRSKEAMKFSGVPDSITSKIQAFKKEIAELEKKEIQPSISENEKNEIVNTLFEKKRAFESLTQQLKQQNQQYYDLTFSKPSFLLSDIQSILAPDQALIEYFLGEETLYCFSYSKNQAQVFKTQIDSSFFKNLQLYRSAYSKKKGLELNANEFAQAGYEVYDKLLSKVLKSLPTEITQMTIIPDGELNFLPFELLITEKVKEPSIHFSQLPYLMKKYTVAYAYSFHLWQEQLTHLSPANRSIISFAPEYKFNTPDTTDQLIAELVRAGEMPLPGAQEEVLGIHQILSGEKFIGLAATKENFEHHASNASIIHLSMHALVNNEKPLFSKLLFAKSEDAPIDPALYVSDLYQMDLNANLAVLSACNTGFGKISRGEGIMSLSRAFAYAGVPSTVMSLWKVPDDATSKIMVEFYKNLKSGKSKDIALRDAKLTYLNNISVPELAHPFYWAGFVASGDMKALKLSGKFSYWWLLVLLLIPILYFLRRSPRKI